MDVNERSLKLHEEHHGKYEICSKVPVKSMEDLSVAYTPGVAEPCRKIRDNVDDVYKYTSKGSTIAVISDGTAVLGLGDIGPEASLPVMEGKAILFKEFAGVNAIPIAVRTKEVDEIVQFCKWLEPTIGGINLEDISAPRCFEIERRLKEELSIPVFHDDQHGTAVIVGSAVINASRLTKKPLNELKVLICGFGAAGIAIAKLLHQLGINHIVAADSKGVVNKNNIANPEVQKMLDEHVIEDSPYSTMAEAIKGMDGFIGVSAADVLSEDMVASMADKSFVFAMANPSPEIQPDLAKKAGAYIVGTGRSDFPNQINNVLVFPGIFKGALAARAEQITDDMKLAAAHAIAGLITDEELNEEYILPTTFDPRVADAVAATVKKAAE